MSIQPSAQAQAADAFELVITLSAAGQPSTTATKPFKTREDCLAGASEIERSTKATRGDSVRFESRCEPRDDAPPVVSASEATPERVTLWQNLQSGMTPEEVVGALQTQNIRARVFTDRTSGGSCVEARDKARVAGLKASIELYCIDNRLFHVDLRYRVPRLPGVEREEQFVAMSRALAQVYGPALAANSVPDIIHSSSAGVVQQQSATFRQNGLKVDLTVNGAFGGNITPSETVIIRYWRVVDAEGYALYLSRKAQQEQEERDRRLRKGL
jgi:hypothetical protein